MLVKRLIQHYAFQPVRTNTGKLVSDIVLVRSPFRGADDRALYERHKHEILFLGISSFEDYPLPSGTGQAVGVTLGDLSLCFLGVSTCLPFDVPWGGFIVLPPTRRRSRLWP